MTSPYGHMVALGSSFAAGPGIKPVVDRRASRSGENYPHLVAQALGADLVDATVSGATTANILDTSQQVWGRRFPPQVHSVRADTDLVTITAGGNDLEYVGGIMRRALAQRLRRGRGTGPVLRRLRPPPQLESVEPHVAQAAEDGLVRIVEGVRQRSPRARVVLVDYLPIFTEGTRSGPDVPLDPEEIAHFRRVAAVLSSVFIAAGRRTGAEVLPASDHDQTHGAGTPEPWVRGFRLGLQLKASFHPLPAGMHAVADRLLERLAGPVPENH